MLASAQSRVGRESGRARGDELGAIVNTQVRPAPGIHRITGLKAWSADIKGSEYFTIRGARLDERRDLEYIVVATPNGAVDVGVLDAKAFSM